MKNLVAMLTFTIMSFKAHTADFKGNWEETFSIDGGFCTHTAKCFYFFDDKGVVRGPQYNESLTVRKTVKKGVTIFEMPSEDKEFQKAFLESLDPEIRKKFQPSEDDYLPGFSLRVNCTREDFLLNLEKMGRSGYKL